MALRVLLADESSTIKKVMQLALHDYGVEVRAVPVGLDVLPVTKAFKPDIIFADVMLTKRTGYDVCSDLKKDPQTSHVPVVLMWSSFMVLDEKKFMDSRANQKLEKPFDSEILRTIVKSLVPKTNTNLISEFLTFPKMPTFADEEESTEDFAQVPLTTKPNLTPVSDSWSTEKLGSVQKNLKDTNTTLRDPNFPQAPLESLGTEKIESSGEFEEITFNGDTNDLLDIDTEPNIQAPLVEPASRGADLNRRIQESVLNRVQEAVTPTAAAPLQDIVTPMMPSPARIEALIKEQAKEIIEKICWQVLPDIAERVVREEINKLLKDVEKSI